MIHFRVFCAELLPFFICLMIVSLIPEPAFSHDNAAYSHDSKRKSNRPNWMVGVFDTTPLSKVSIPGTHDSMSLHGGIMAQTQSLSLKDQLIAGIRALDIRVRKAGSKFAIHHGPVYQHAMFGGVLNTVTQHLKTYPSEFVVMRISHEAKAKDILVDGYSNPTKGELQKILNEYLKDPKWSKYFWKPTGKKSDHNPPVGDIRGKIVLFQLGPVPKSYGIPYPDTKTPYSQDDFQIKGYIDGGIYNKWKAVKKSLGWVNNHKTIPPVSINYLSATGVGGGNPLAFPYTVASGHVGPKTNDGRIPSQVSDDEKKFPDFPRTACLGKLCTILIEGINTLTYDRLGKKYKSKVGILMADFPGPGLINRIIQLNRGMDLGYKRFRRFADIDGDGDADYCREIGDPGHTFINCALSNGKELEFRGVVSLKGDLGYKQFRRFADIDGDGDADYCRLVGNKPQFIRCELYQGKGRLFSGHVELRGDLGYPSFREFADVDGDGDADFCREVGSKPHTFITCEISLGKQHKFKSRYNLRPSGGDLGYTRFRRFADIDGDGDADYCREVGNEPHTFINCDIWNPKKRSFEGIVSIKGDLGYARFRQFADIDGDGDADYCREVGNPGKTFIICEISHGKDHKFEGHTTLKVDVGYKDLRKFADIDGDGDADYNREVGDRPASWIGAVILDGTKRTEHRILEK